MQTRAKIFDDLAKVAGGAASTLSGLKSEVESLARQQIERILANIDVVPRDEFDAVQGMAAKARSGQEALEKRVRELEKKLGIKAPAKAKAKAKAKTKTPTKTKAKAKAKAKAKTKAPAKAKTKAPTKTKAKTKAKAKPKAKTTARKTKPKK